MAKVPDSQETLAQFNRLIEELLQGGPSRGRYQKWEIEILLDIESCNLDSKSAARILPEFQEEVQRKIKQGARRVLKLSDFLRDKNRISK